LLIGAGGTGGHVYPASALATELVLRGAEVVWVGRPESLEQRVAAELCVRFLPLPAAGFFGKGLAGKALGIVRAMTGVLRCFGLFREAKPDFVVAAGGFVSAAPLAAAWLQRVPYYLLEQNCVPGRVTRFFAPGAREVFLAFPTEKRVRGICVVTGGPLRPTMRGGRADDGRTVLVLGGSLGAQALNLAALDAAATLTNLHFIIVTGSRDYAMVRSRVRSHNCELVEFTSRPEELYRRATIAVSRSGGVVLSELMAFGIPAILVPFPYATDGHQEANARYAVAAGAGIMLDQSGLSGLTEAVRALIEDGPRRAAMSRAALNAARPDAAQRIAERILGCSAG